MARVLILLFVLAQIIFGRVDAASPAPAYNGKYHGPWYPFGQSKMPFAKAVGRHFSYNGKVQYFTGVNTWWLSRLRNNSDIDTVLDELQSANVYTVRVWGYATFNFTPPVDYGNMYGCWFQLLNQSGTYVNYGANGLARLDYLVYAAEQRNMSIVLPVVDYNTGLGGINLYKNVFGCNTKQWYTDTNCQNAYLSYLQTIVLRYMSSPAIFAWEIMNEPRCEGCSTSIITKWATSVSQFVKSIDPNHMVALGDEGWFGKNDGVGDGNYPYDGSEGVDWLANLKISTLDYGTFHDYPIAYNYPLSWGSTWIIQHDQIAAQVGKPAVAEEYGTPFGPNNHTGETGWQTTILQNTSIAMDSIFDFTTPYLSVGVPYSDTASVFYNNTPLFTTLIANHAKAMLSKPVT